MAFFDRVRAMPIERQVLLAAGSLVILAFVLGGAYFVFLRQPDSVLFSNLRPMDAATIVADLDKRKVPYHLADGGTTILVAQNQADATRLSVMSEDLPLKGTVGFELFNKSDIGLTEFAQKINYQRALQGELARTIMAIDAVDTARVHLSLPDPSIFQDDKRAPKASIALTPKPGKLISPGAVRGIQRLVAAAVPDLNVSNVVVLDGEGQVISSDIVTVDTPLAPTTSESAAQHAAETYYNDKVRQALSATYPDHDFTIKVVAKSPDGTPTATSEDGVFAAWTPELRKFPLTVTIGDASAGDTETMHNIRVAAASAISENPALGDDITVTPQGTAATGGDGVDNFTNLSKESHSAAKPLRPLTGQDPSFPWTAVLTALAVVCALAACAVLLWMRRNDKTRRKLTEAERREFASRFRTLLERGDNDVADRL